MATTYTDCDGVIRSGAYRFEFGKWVIDHDVNDSLDYSQDISLWMAKSNNDTIASVALVTDPRVTYSNISHDATTMSAWLTVIDGSIVSLGELLEVTYRVTSAHSPPRIKDWTIYLKIVEG